MASWWEDYKKRKGLSSGGSESSTGKTYTERITTDEHRQAAKSSTWWEDYKKKNDLERRAAADRQRAAQSASRLKYRSERNQRFASANRQLKENRNRDAAEDEIRELFRNPFSTDAEWQAGVLQRNAERYKRDLPLYQQALQNASTWGEYFSTHRQAGESQSAVKHQFERYQQAAQNAEQERNESNLVNRPAQWQAENLSPQEIERRLAYYRSEEATPTVTDRDREARAYLYPEAALQKDPHGARFDERLVEDAGQDAVDAAYKPILTEQEKAAVEEADQQIIKEKAERNYEQVQRLLAAQKGQTEMFTRARGNELIEEIAQGGEAAKQVETGRAAFEAKQQQIASETSFEIGDDLDSNRGAYNKMQKERRERGYILGYDWDNVPEARKQAVYALYAQDPEKAMELAKYYIADARQAEDEERQAWYAQSGWTAALGLVSSAAAHLGAAVDPFGDVGQELTRRGDNALAGGSQWADAATGYQKIPEWVPIVGGKGAGDFYQTVGSVVQSAAVAAPAILAGRYDKAAAEIISNLGLALMGSSAAASDYRESVAAGMDEDRAKLHALAAGVEEALFEEVSLDKLIKMDTSGGLKAALKNWLVQSGIEGSEELATSIANRFTDEMISGAGQSKVERRASELIANGMSSTEAHTQAESEWMTDTLYDGFSGFLSGGMMTGGNYALQGLANLKGRAVNAAETRKAQKQAGAAVSRSEGSVEALQAYAKDKGIEIKAVETADQNAEQGGQDANQNSYSSRDYRSISDTTSKVTQSIRNDLRGKTVQEQQAVRDSLVEKYGEGIAPVVNNAISIETAARVRLEYGDVDSIQAARNQAVSEIKDESLRRAVSDGYDSAAYSLAASQGGEDGMNTMSRYIQQRKNTGSGAEMTMNATVTAQDGSTKSIAITGMSEDGKRVSLADGSEVAVKDIQADADTTSAIQQLADLDLGDDATKVLQAYQQSGVSGTDGYRWLMDYATAYNQGRTRQISLEQAAQRSSLDERTVMDAYTLGQQAANRETQAGLEKLKNLPKRKGANGRAANIDTTEIRGKTMSKSELEQFELANQYAQALGVDMTWFSSREKDGKFIDKNGAYENGKIYMDIHAGRNFAADLTSGILATMGHELTHFQQQYAPEEYQAIKEFLFEQIVKSSPNGEARLERLIWEKQRRSGYTLSRKAAEDEVVADACQKMLRDSKAVHDFANQQPEAANGVVRWLDKWFKRVRSIFGRGGNYSEEAQIMDSLEQDVKAAFGELWDKALKQAVQVHDEVGNIEKPATESETKEESKAQNSDRDAEYLELAKDPEKNADRLQEMVDEAARSAGYNIKVYHGTTQETISASKGRVPASEYAALEKNYADKLFPFVVFKNNGFHTGIYTATDRGVAEDFSFSFSHGGTVYDLYAKSEKPLVIDAQKNSWRNLPKTEAARVGLTEDVRQTLDSYKKTRTKANVYMDDIVEFAKKNGYDAVIVENVRETGSGDETSPLTTDVVVFSSNQLKSADPVTYDDSGNVIPLSQRFNTENQDIRYSQREQHEEAVEASDVLTRYSLREAPAPQKTIKAYKAFYVKDGKLYPPMVSNNTNEEDKQTVKKASSGTMKGLETPVGVWLDADVGGIAVDENGVPLRTKTTGRLQVQNDKGGGTLAFRPGWHLGEWPDASQFNVKDPVTGALKSVMPDNLVFAECEIAADVDYQLEAYEYGISDKGGFSRTQAGLPRVPTNGYYKYRTNVDPTTAPWYITGAMKVTRILSDEERRQICNQFGVTPQERASHKDIDLEAYGLKAGPVKQTENLERFRKNKASYDNDALLKAALEDENYSNAYVRRTLDFDNETLVKEFELDRISPDQVKKYRESYQSPEVMRSERESAAKANVPLDSQSESAAPSDGTLFSERDELASDNQIHDITNRSGETVGVQDGNGHVQFSQRTWRESGKEKMQEYLDERVRKYEANRNDPEGMHPDDAKALMDAVQEQYDALDEIVRQQPGNYKTYEKWADAEVETDIFGNPVFSWLKANGDYGISGDASLICVKRRTLDAVFDYMIRENMIQDGPEGLKLAQESIVAINDIIRAHGFETACSTCYIDARRYRAAIVAGSFCNVYNKLVRSMLKGKTGVPINAFNFGGNKSVTPLANSLDTLSDSEINWDGINKAIRDQEAKWESKGWEKFTEDGEEKWRRNGTVKNLPTSGTTEYRIALALKEKPSLRKLALRSDFLSGNGFLELNRTNKDILTLYNVKKGQAGPKATETDIQYLHEALENSFITPERMFKAGGFRLQSFSDYVPRLVFDYVEIIGDLSAKGVPAHMYTKEILCVLQHGLTGTKINMSLIPAMVKKGFAPGLDADGNYLWRDGQTFGSTAYSLSPKLEAHLSKILGYQVKGRLTGAQGFELAKLIQNDPAYGKNNGTIAIGVSEAQIRKMLDDADIRMVIPYHKSGLNHILASMMEIPGFENYESYQNTLKWNGTKWSKVDVDFDFNEAVQKHKGDARAAAQDYLDWCNENGYKPKFSGVASGSARNSYNKAYDFTQHADWQTGEMTGEAERNYYKVLADFTCYDAEGNVSRQEAVKLNYPGTDSAFGSMKQLIEMGLESDAMLQAKQDAEVPKIVADIVREIPKFEAAGRNMKAYAQLKENVEGRQYSEREYLDAVDRGDMETAKRLVEEAARKAGYTVKGYHGTPDFGFTVLDVSKSDDKISFFVTSSVETARTYSGVDGTREISEDVDQSRDLTKAVFNLISDAEKEAGVSGIIDKDNAAKGIIEAVSKVKYSYEEQNIASREINNVLEQIYDAAEIKTPFHVWLFRNYRMDSGLLTNQYDAVVSETMLYMDRARGDINEGNYRVFIDPTNLLEIDGGGAKWNEIEFAPTNDSNGYSKTRDIAKWAKDNGYSGVLFKGIVDDGGIGRQRATKPSDVYALFNPQAQVKSADPVTYDRSGNVIPLSERFNEANEDIRFSERDYSTPSDEELLMNARVEDAANVEQGRLLEEYQALGQRIATLEKQLAEARLQTQLTNRALNTRGIGNVVKTVMRDYDITDARHNNTAKNATLALTEGYQKALDLLDKGASPAEVNDAVYNGAVKAAEIILEQGTYSQNLGGKWQTYSASRYLGESRQELIDSFVSEAYADFVSNRYREARPETAADRLVARTKKEAQERVDKYKGRSDALAEANRRLEEKKTQAETEAKEARKAAGELFLEIKDLRQELMDNKTMSEQERKAASKKLKSLNTRLESKQKEAANWQKRAKRNASLLKSALESKNRDISALNNRLSKEQAAALEKQKNLETKLEKQIQRERDILAGKLRAPELVKMLKAEREKAEARVKEQKEQVFQNYKERKKAGELRRRIVRHSKELYGKLTKPSDKRHIPEAYRGAVAALLNTINLESAYDIQEGTKNESGRGGKHVEKGTGTATNRTKAFQEVRKQLEKVLAEGGFTGELINNAAEGFDGGLIEKCQDFADKPISTLSSEELETLWNTIRALEHNIATFNKAFALAKTETISGIADKFLASAQKRKPLLRDPKSRLDLTVKKTSGIAMKALENPYTFFSHYGEEGVKLFRALRDTQDLAIVRTYHLADLWVSKMTDILGDEKTANLNGDKLTDAILDKIRDTSKQMDEKVETFKLENGQTITLTHAMLMDVYLLSQRGEVGMNHLLGSGLIQPEIRAKGKYVARDPSFRKLSLQDVQKMTEVITENATEKAIADAIQSMQHQLADWGNEASMDVFGYRKFTEDNYWPVKNAKEENKSDSGKGGNQPANAMNKGMAKNLVPHAATGMEPMSAFTKLQGSISDMLVYATWGPVMEDFKRFYNWKWLNPEGGTSDTVKGVMERYGGEGSQRYWEELRDQINNGVGGGKSFVDQFIGKAVGVVKGARVAFNLRVVAQQPTAYARAAEVISGKYLAASLLDIKSWGWKAKSAWNRALTHSPIAMRKDSTTYDMGGNISAGGEFGLDRPGRLDKARDFGTALAGKADAITWGRLWHAAELQVSAKTELEYGSQEYWDAVNKLFTDAVDRTQVVDGLLQRPAIMRTDSDFVKGATSYMGEPLMQLNMLMRQVNDFRQTGFKATKKQIGKTVTALVVTQLINAMLTGLYDAGIRKDDKDKDFWERFMAEITGLDGTEENAWDYITSVWLESNVASEVSVMQKIPLVKDVLSMLQGYDPSNNRMDLEAIKDLIDVCTKVLWNDNYTPLYKAKEMINKASMIFGAGFGNALKDMYGVTRNIINDFGKPQARFDFKALWLNPASKKNKSQYFDLLFQMLENGDKDAFRQRAKKLAGQDGMLQYVAKAAIERYLTDGLSPADVWDMMEAARDDGMSDEKFYDYAHGRMADAIKKSYLNRKLEDGQAITLLMKYAGKDEQTAWKKVQEWADKAEHTDEEGELEDGYEYSVYNDLFKAVDANQDAEKVIKDMVQNGGYEADSLRGKIKEHLRERFIAGEITETALKNQLSRYCKIVNTKDVNEIVANAKCKRDFGVYPDALKEAFKDGDLSQNQAVKALQQYNGLSKTDAQNLVQYWNYDGDLSESAWLKWNNELKRSGLSVENWEKVSKVKSDAKGTDANGDGKADYGTAKAEVVSYIDSMNIPKSQKKAIYLAFGWAASTMPNWR